MLNVLDGSPGRLEIAGVELELGIIEFFKKICCQIAHLFPIIGIYIYKDEFEF